MINCPMCLEGKMKHKAIKLTKTFPLPNTHTHLYSCNECPFIGFEYYSVDDTNALLSFLNQVATKIENEKL